MKYKNIEYKQRLYIKIGGTEEKRKERGGQKRRGVDIAQTTDWLDPPSYDEENTRIYIFIFISFLRIILYNYLYLSFAVVSQ